MPVGSHKDAFKAHQVVKRIGGANPNPLLARFAADILLDFVKNQRQIRAENAEYNLPQDSSTYEPELVDKALEAVESLCGKCDESHDNACFVNQARRTLITARVGVDPGSEFDGKTSLSDLIARARELLNNSGADVVAVEVTSRAEEEPKSEDSVWKHKYEELKEKDVFRATLIDEVVSTISSVTQGNFATEMPVHDDEQLAKLATAFNLMLSAIKTTMGNLDKLVSERSAQMRMIMDTVPVGLMTINENLRIQPEYSKSCESILGLDDLRGRDFLDAIGITHRREEDRVAFADYFDICFKKLIDDDQQAFLNPFPELELAGAEGRRSTWLKLQFKLIDRGNDPSLMLVIVKDITESKLLQEKVAQSEKENTQLKVIAEDPDLFCEFLREARGILKDGEALLEKIQNSPDPKNLVNNLFRGVHTIKGSAGAMGLAKVSSLAGVLENSLNDLRKADAIAPQTLGETRVSLDEIKAEVEKVVKETERLLGVKLDGGQGMTLRIESSSILKNMAYIAGLPLEKALVEDINSRLEKLRRIDVKRGLGRSLKIIPGLRDRVGKDILFELEDNGVKIDCDIAMELNGPLVHLLRNAYDHGIEQPEDRELAGKPAEGRVSLKVEEAGQGLSLTVSDDGKGLNPKALRDSAVKKGIITQAQADAMSDEESRKLIFMAGFSTAQELTDVSGRGVGMDAVIATVKNKLGGDISIDSTPGSGTSITISLPKNSPF